MKTLHLNLKRKWFDLILSGEKKEEYRDIKSFYYGRLVNTENLRSFFKCRLSYFVQMAEFGNHTDDFWDSASKGFEGSFKKYDTITFSNGYAKDRDQFVIELKGIKISSGRTEWGAEKGRKYFVLELGKIIKN